MNKKFPFVEIPSHLLNILGEPDKGTRLYRVFGREEDVRPWFDAICEVTPGLGSMSPGGIYAYVKVSRPAVHKRLKEGRLTGFFFHQVMDGRFFKDRKRLDEGGRPFILIPVVEARAWAEELKERQELADEERSISDTTRKYDSIEKPPRSWRKSLRKD